MNDPILGFQCAIADAGLGQPDIVADGLIHRFDTTDDKRGKKSGWFVFHHDSIAAGAFGTWKTGASHTWCSKDKKELTDDERAAYRESIRKARIARDAEQKRLHAEAATECRELFGKASEQINHAYVTAKGIKPYGLRQLRNMLLVPMYLDGTLVNLQFISAKPNPETGKYDKTFKRGGRKKDCYYAIGESSDSIYICEGYSTGASIFEAVGGLVVIAFDCGNLKPVAVAIRKKYPDATITICADDDKWKDHNAGIAAGKDAATTVGASLVSPQFTDISTKPTDFNDLHQMAGLDAVREQVMARSVEEEHSGGGGGITTDTFLARLSDAIGLDVAESDLAEPRQEIVEALQETIDSRADKLKAEVKGGAVGFYRLGERPGFFFPRSAGIVAVGGEISEWARTAGW